VPLVDRRTFDAASRAAVDSDDTMNELFTAENIIMNLHEGIDQRFQHLTHWSE
jgi:hypothetical protein